jgi:hypothetical protein
MPSFGNQNQENPGINWLAVVRILLVQVLVLLALSGAIIGYLDWSSDAAWGEFIAASKPAASDLVYRPDARSPVQTVGSQTPCIRIS